MNAGEELELLCQRLSESDREAFEEVFKFLFEDVLLYVRGITRSDDAAQDVAQETFAKLWEVRASLDPDASLKAYIFRIARNRAYNQVRDQKTRRDNEALRHPDGSHSSRSAPPDEVVDARLLEAQLEYWVETLPRRQREALTLRRDEDLSHAEIADIMDISPRTVNNHLVRAMKTLRAQMEVHRADGASSDSDASPAPS